jgi:hypothetical protein
VSGPILVGTPMLEQRLSRFDGGYSYTNERAVTRAVLDHLDEATPGMPAALALLRRVCRPSEREAKALRVDAEALVLHFADYPWAAPIHEALKEALRHEDHAVLTLAVIHAMRVNAIMDVEELMSGAIMKAMDAFVKPARKPRKKPAKKKTAAKKRAAKGKK